MTPNEIVIQLRGEYECDVGAMAELRDSIQAGKIVSRPLDETAQRDWLRRAVQDGVRYSWSAATLTITALIPDVPYGRDADIERDKRSADRVRAADQQAVSDSAKANVEVVRANAKRAATKD